MPPSPPPAHTTTVISKSPLVCATDEDFLHNMRYIQTICCDQLGEGCGSQWFPEQTCKHTLCAHAINRVQQDCAPFLKTLHAQRMWEPLAKQLTGVWKQCQLGRPYGSVYAVTTVKLNPAVPTRIITCSGILTAGRGSVQEWSSTAILQSQQVGFGIELDFFTFYLGPGNSIFFYDGECGVKVNGKLCEPKNLLKKIVASSSPVLLGSPTLRTLKIKNTFLDKQVSSLMVQVFVGNNGKGETPITFGAKIRCVAPCEDSNQFTRHTGIVTKECCDEPTETCKGGLPQTCNHGCAHVIRGTIFQCKAFLKSNPIIPVCDSPAGIHAYPLVCHKPIQEALDTAQKKCPPDQLGDEAAPANRPLFPSSTTSSTDVNDPYDCWDRRRHLQAGHGPTQVTPKLKAACPHFETMQKCPAKCAAFYGNRHVCRLLHLLAVCATLDCD
eukprot:SAG25_NODE_43_length_19261_cov_111.931218_10_plen_440_part_00